MNDADIIAAASQDEILAATALKDFLLAHESDIAAGINDYGCLLPVFQRIILRDPVRQPGDRNERP